MTVFIDDFIILLSSESVSLILTIIQLNFQQNIISMNFQDV
jgi:hypothetical protein